MAYQTTFKSIELRPGIRFSYLKENKWKTLSAHVFCKIPLTRETVTPIAVVPRLAKRGTAKYHSIRELSTYLESMYGASMGADVSKVGPVQVVRFGIELPSPSFLDPGKMGSLENINLEQAINFIWDLATRPYLEQGAYLAERFQHEVEEHRRDILGIINHRTQYATVRLIQHLSQNDPRGLPSWGVLEDLPYLEPAGTWNTWVSALSDSPISVYAVGEKAEEIGEILTWKKLEFPGPRYDNGSWDLETELTPPPLPGKLIDVEEFLPGNQTIVCMAFSTGVTQQDPRFPILLMYDGILGGFPHSKLFQVIREKENLAYFADTSVNAWRGHINAVAGVEDDDRNKVKELVIRQVELIKNGEITQEEIEVTKAGLVRRFMSERDSQAAQIRRSLNQEVLGGLGNGDELVEKIMKVTLDQIVEVAKQVELKAVYALRAKGGQFE